MFQIQGVPRNLTVERYAISKEWFSFFCAVNITGDIKNCV